METLKSMSAGINTKLVDLQVLVYTMLNKIKQQHDKLLQFIGRAQIQSQEQKVAHKSFDKIRIWEAKNDNMLEGISRMSDEEKIQIQASLDAWFSNCEFSKDLISETIKYFSDIWDSTIDINEDHYMPHV
jgi:hypothetical protein